MDIVKNHNTKSKPVTKYKEIREAAEELVKFTKNFVSKESGYPAYAIHHTQVCENPYNFFVLHPKKNAEYKFFESDIIINPKIIGGGAPVRVGEACMSFPHRKEKYVERYSILDVQYQIPVRKLKIGPYQLKTVRAKLTDLVAQIFAHETDHGDGRNIHGF